MAMQPNIIIEGRGYRQFAKVLPYETYKKTKSTERYPLDARKTNAKLVALNDEVKFMLVVVNDGDEDDDFVITSIETQVTGWTFNYNEYDPTGGGSVITLPYTLNMAAKSRKAIEVVMKAPVSSSVTGEVAYAILKAKSSDSNVEHQYEDNVKCVAVTPIVVYEDVVKTAEGLIEDEELFPDYMAYSDQETCENFINEETELVIKDLLGRMDGVQIDEYDKLRSYIIQRVLWREVSRATQFAVDGGSFFESSLRLIANEADRLWTMIFYGDDG
jgi:hypothetical protein